MSQNIETKKPINIAIIGLGGQGVITLTKLIANVSFGLGKKVCYNEIHGLAQRGGSVQSLVRINESENPVFAARDVDYVIGLEKLEALRYLYLAKGSKAKVIITNKYLIRPTSDLGYEQFPDEDAIESEIKKYASELYLFDALGFEENTKTKFKPLNVAVFSAMTTFQELDIPPTKAEDLVAEYLGRNMIIRQINKKAFKDGPKWLRRLE
ncbi:MAG: 2-oxoacid:acceptor oxidoreductase family protein [Candidatus Heimdallarchaeaceae archaeon]